MEKISSEVDKKVEISPEKIQEIGKELEKLSGLVENAATQFQSLEKFSGNEGISMKDLKDAVEKIEYGKRTLYSILSTTPDENFKDGKRPKNRYLSE